MYHDIILLLVMAKKTKGIFWGVKMNACWRKNTCSFFIPKPFKMWGKNENVNLGKLTDFQIRYNNPYKHLL